MTRLVRVISDLAHGSHFIVVGKCDQYITSCECIEGVVTPTFDVRVVPYLIILSHSHKSLNIGIKRVVWVKGSPKRLTISGIITSFEALLGTIVNDRDSLRINNKSKS